MSLTPPVQSRFYSRFIDEAVISVAGGHGGPGCVSFRRETFAPRGGPDGGDGGDGGSVIFSASSQLGSLQDLRFKRYYQAPNGMHGSGSNKAGKDGENIQIRVPVGTVLRNAETLEILVDLTQDGQTWIACKGGRGGKGNAHFVTSTHQAPKFAQPGEEGERLEIKLELKLLADVGIIGRPNAGKSTLISRMSRARPKIADYPFTTLTPHLGVVSLPEHETFVVADIPGLIEGAHQGAGLGHKFLKHLERTQLFIHLLDGTQLLEDATSTSKNPVDQLVEHYQMIRKELGLFHEKLLHRPEMVVINKIDLLESDPELIRQIQKSFRQKIASIRDSQPQPGEPWVISAVSGSGIDELLFAIQKELKIQKSSIKLGLKSELCQKVKLPDHEGIRA